MIFITCSAFLVFYLRKILSAALLCFINWVFLGNRFFGEYFCLEWLFELTQRKKGSKMESAKKQGSAASSLTADLFGFKEPPPKSSTGIFASIFPPPSQVYLILLNSYLCCLLVLHSISGFCQEAAFKSREIG